MTATLRFVIFAVLSFPVWGWILWLGTFRLFHGEIRSFIVGTITIWIVNILAAELVTVWAPYLFWSSWSSLRPLLQTLSKLSLFLMILSNIMVILSRIITARRGDPDFTIVDVAKWIYVMWAAMMLEVFVIEVALVVAQNIPL